MYEEELRELGLTDNESKIYLLLIQEGAMRSTEIAHKLGFHRGYVYDTLDRMMEKEVCTKTTVDNKNYFKATAPADLLHLMSMKLAGFEAIIPDLQKLNTPKEELDVQVFKGKKAYRMLLSDMMNHLIEGDEAYFVGIDEEMLLTEVEPHYFKQFLNVMETKKVKEKLIIRKGAKKVQFSNLQYKELPAKYVGDAMHIIYNEKVGVFLAGAVFHLILIRNARIAETYRKQFKLLWESAV